MTVPSTEKCDVEPKDNSGLINPLMFVCRWMHLDTNSIHDGADSLRTMGTKVRDSVQGVRMSWSSLQSCYEGPEQEIVYALMDDPREAAEDLKERLFSAAVQLDTYADIILDIGLQLLEFEERVWDFRAEAQRGYDITKSEPRGGNLPDRKTTEHQTWQENATASSKNTTLLEEYAGYMERISNAATYCANAINDLQMGSIETPCTAVTAEQVMASSKQLKWGEPVAQDKGCEQQVWDGAGNWAKDSVVGVTSLAGYDFDPTTSRKEVRDQAWLGVGDFLISAGISLSPISYAAYLPGVKETGFAGYIRERHHTALVGVGSMAGWDEAEAAAGGDGWHKWKENPFEAGTEALLNVGTFAIPVGGWIGGSAKAVSKGGRVARVATSGGRGVRVVGTVADVLIPGGSHIVSGAAKTFSKGLEKSRGRTSIVDDIDLAEGAAKTGSKSSPSSSRTGRDEVSATGERSSTGVTDRVASGPEGRRVSPDEAGAERSPESSSKVPEGRPHSDSSAALKEGQSASRLTPDGRGTTVFRPGSYDPEAPVHSTEPAKGSGHKFNRDDVQRALDDAPQNEWGQPVDHRNGRPLKLEDAAGRRGWVMRWDSDSQSWVPENRSLHEHGLPAKGEPGTFGYDDNGDLLPYANHRPDYAPGQVEEVWNQSRNSQLEAIADGDLDLPEPGRNEMWVRTVDDAQGPGLQDLGIDGKWKKISWDPNSPRGDIWDMGHNPGEEYRKLRNRYLNHEISANEYLESYRTSENYRVQDPARNRSHVDEME